jgi:hypothetical protein
VIPTQRLSPERAPEVFVVETPFPPDDRSAGYERGTSISKAWDEATTRAAIETAGYVTKHLEELAAVRKGGAERQAKAREFCGRLVERAFHRPLAGEEQRLYIDAQLIAAPDLETAVTRVVLLALKSPRFLYPELGGGEPDAYTLASRLSFALWDSLPDQELLDEAAAGRLASRQQVLRQAVRMISDPRTRAKMRQFLNQWLDIERVSDLPKDEKRFPGFDEKLAADLRASLDLFLDEVIWDERSDFRRLLLSSDLYLNGRLAEYYGFNLAAGSPFQKVSAGEPRRAGVLSHPYLMARFAYPDAGSPIHRGVFVIRKLLGRALRPPPEAFVPLAPDLRPDLTTRERIALQTEPKACQSCHGLINPLGFTLERFDAVGRYREEDQGKPIDASGAYKLRTGETKTFDGARELAEFLAGSEEVQRSFVSQLFHYLVKQPILAYGKETAADLRRHFAARDFHVRKLMAEIATTAALTGIDGAAEASPLLAPAPGGDPARGEAADESTLDLLGPGGYNPPPGNFRRLRSF